MMDLRSIHFSASNPTKQPPLLQRRRTNEEQIVAGDKATKQLDITSDAAPVSAGEEVKGSSEQSRGDWATWEQKSPPAPPADNAKDKKSKSIWPFKSKK